MGGAVVDTGDCGVKAPDGGWGWAVLFGCFVITGFSYAFPKAVSVFFKELIREFGVGYSDTAWISSILLAMLYGTGPICSILVNRFGCRPVMMVGGLFASLGMILASFATNIIHIYICTGVITGLGLALNFQPSLIMLNRYFSEKRPLANGLAAAGSPVALCCLSPLGQVLQYNYGWRGGFLILGGILLNCCACGALMRPLTAPKKTSEVEEKEKETKPKPKPKLLDFTVFKDCGFLIYTVAAAIMVLGLFVPPVFVVSYAKELGNEDTKSSLLLTILGFVDMFARPTCGVIAGLKWVRPRCVYLLSFAMIFNGTTDLIGSMSKDYPSLVVFCIFFGISYGMVGALQFEVLMAIVGTKKFSSAIGLVLLVEAFAVLLGPPGAGLLLDVTKNYMYVFLLAGCEVFLSALVLGICNMLFIKRKPEQPDPPAKMEMAIIDAEMEELNKAPKNEQDRRGGQNGKKQAVEQEAMEKSDSKIVEEPESIGVDSIELENSSKNVTEPNGVVVEPESSL
ncbi:monocarboxylate transporter 4-like [Carassius auratus]|uniref:Monocarboxylate transporter 4-like n=1 Tax=Carassius auratus TaxID=7957 RepID=A0A6P6M1P2_CARAU|nr:monocarboxylate transporter 4-like [Carassius auratus]XP_026090573.1 monocarboxylate transporter 4-like [Carassius auratus]XP_026090574.1 monocarboxylate transporter 4-like [Carassius auratus]